MPVIRFVFCAFAALLLAVPFPASAQTSVAADEEVTVTRQRVQDLARAFVGEVTVESGQSGQLARWDRRICPGVMGLRPAQAQAIVDRIALRALDVGLVVGEPGCRANIFVIVTNDADALAGGLYAEHRQLLGYYDGTGVTRGRRALRDFAETPRAVRWWHVARSTSERGLAERTGLRDTAPTASTSGSRILRATEQIFSHVIVIVDANRIVGTRVETLGDYLAMASLAQLDPEADFSGYPTILNFFGGGSAAESTMTTWDVAYLQGLYESRPDTSSDAQANVMVRSLARSTE